MKKSVRILILSLMLFTSLTAGTLAVYTSTIDLSPVTIAAKRFALDVNQGGQDEFDLRIGPGELVSYQFVVTNENANGDVSEVDMDLAIYADFSAIRESLPDVEISLLMRSGGEDSQVASAGSTGTISYTGVSLFKAGVAKEVDFVLTFYWNDSQMSGSMLGGEAVVLPMTVYVKGVQHVY